MEARLDFVKGIKNGLEFQLLFFFLSRECDRLGNWHRHNPGSFWVLDGIIMHAEPGPDKLHWLSFEERVNGESVFSLWKSEKIH